MLKIYFILWLLCCITVLCWIPLVTYTGEYFGIRFNWIEVPVAKMLDYVEQCVGGSTFTESLNMFGGNLRSAKNGHIHACLYISGSGVSYN